MSKKLFGLVLAAAALTLVLSACGGSAQPVTLTDIPVYAGAKEFKPGESAIGDTLANNMKQNAALTKAVGTGGTLEQKGFSLPSDGTWDAVSKFYDDKLKATGWNTDSTTASVLAVVNQSNDAFQTATYLRGNQNLSIIRMTDPVSKSAWMFLSLNTH